MILAVVICGVGIVAVVYTLVVALCVMAAKGDRDQGWK